MHNFEPLSTTLEDALATKAAFTDYKYFEDSTDRRTSERDHFFENRKLLPEYAYPKLTRLVDAVEKGDTVDVKKANIQNAVYRIEQALDNNEINPSLAELMMNYYELRYKRILLVEAAKHMHEDGGSTEQQLAREAFMDLNESIYGPIDKDVGFDLMYVAQEDAINFQPSNEIARVVKQDLVGFFSQIDLGGAKRPIDFDVDVLNGIKDYVDEKYGELLELVPKTDDSVHYDSNACAEILSQAVEAAGLADKGWSVEIDPEAQLVTTGNKKIKLPANLDRSADNIRGLIVHEIGVHAQRTQNGLDTKVPILAKGTAEYLEAEEGLAILFESAVSNKDPINNPAIQKARDRYLATAIALGIDGHPRDARQTFEVMWRIVSIRKASETGGVDLQDIEEAKRYVFDQCVNNAYRGTGFYAPGVIYMKSKIYYEGIIRNNEYFSGNRSEIKEKIEKAMLGKYNHLSQEESVLVSTLLREN